MAKDTNERIRITENFLFDRLNDEITIDNIVKKIQLILFYPQKEM